MDANVKATKVKQPCTTALECMVKVSACINEVYLNKTEDFVLWVLGVSSRLIEEEAF